MASRASRWARSSWSSRASHRRSSSCAVSRRRLRARTSRSARRRRARCTRRPITRTAQQRDSRQPSQDRPAVRLPERRRPEQDRAAGRQVALPDAPALGARASRRPAVPVRREARRWRSGATGEEARGGLSGEVAHLRNGNQGPADDPPAELDVEQAEDRGGAHRVQLGQGGEQRVRHPRAVDQEEP